MGFEELHRYNVARLHGEKAQKAALEPGIFKGAPYATM
jgi:hypothetical protein